MTVVRLRTKADGYFKRTLREGFGDDSARFAESRLRLDLMMRVPVERRGFHARNARETPMLLPHALPNHGGSYG